MEVEAGEGTTQGASYNAAKAPEGIAHPGELPKIVEHYLITGEFVWYVHNWNKLENIETNEPICSEVWEAGGHKWQMKLYPGGYTIAPPPEHQKVSAKASKNSAAAAAAGEDEEEDEADPAAGCCNPSDTESDDDADRMAAEAAARAAGHRPNPSYVTQKVKRNRKRHPPLNKFVAVYIMRVGSGKEPQGIVTGEDGSEYVRVWPKITMKDTGPGMTFRNLDQTKGRDSSRQAAVKFSTGPQSWGAKHGYRTFVRSNAIVQVRENTLCRRKSLLKDDTMQIHIQIKILGHKAMYCRNGPFKSEYNMSHFEPLPREINNHMNRLLEGGPTDHGKNVLLLVGVEDSELVQLGAHKQILALRSSVMAKTMREMLEAPGGNTKDLTLRLPFSQAACETMLRVLYTGSPLTPEECAMDRAIELLSMADLFKITRLTNVAECALARHIAVGTAAQLLLVALQYNAKELCRVTVDFIVLNLPKIMEIITQAQWDSLAQQQEGLLLLDRAMRRLGDSSSAAGMGLQQLINNHMADAPQGDGAAAAAHAMLGRVEELQLADEAGNLQENPEQQGFHGVQQPFDPAAAAGAAMGGDNVDGDNDDDEAEVDTSSASDNDSDDNGDAVEAAILAAAAKQLKRARNGSRAAAAAAGAEDPDWANEGGSDSEEDEEGDAAGRRPHKRQRKARTAAAHAGQDWENDADEQGFMGVRRRRDA